MEGKIKFLSNFFKLDVLKKKGLFSRRRQNGSLNHVLSTMFPREKRTKLLGDQVPKYLTRKFRKQMLSKSNIFYTIGNILKVRYCI
jgi:hypothetical protein